MYLLDTNILSELMKKTPNEHFIETLGSVSSQTLFTSSICVLELRFGSALRNDFKTFWSKIVDEIVSRIKVLPFGEDEACIAGDILAHLQKEGRKVGVEDVFIAATALHNKCILVTANTKHYSRINELEIENWIK